MADARDLCRQQAAGGDPDEWRPKGLERFGYRPADAEFLAAAALLGGFFVRRQYRAFTGTKPGGAEHRFMRVAAKNGHVTVSRGRPQLCRLRGASLFRALRCENPTRGNGRLRRSVKQRLLALDYWIAQDRRADFLLGPAAKASHFAELGIPEESFPAAARTRKGAVQRFPDRFPVRIPGPLRPSVQFAYAHAGSTAAGMTRHLKRHAGLAAALWTRGIPCEWAVLADSEEQFPRLRNAWRAWTRRLKRDWSEMEYFSLRLLVQRRQWSDLTREAIERYGQLATRHRGAAPEMRYRAWVREGMPTRPEGGDFSRSCCLREVLMDFDYSAADRAER